MAGSCVKACSTDIGPVEEEGGSETKKRIILQGKAKSDKTPPLSKCAEVAKQARCKGLSGLVFRPTCKLYSGDQIPFLSQMGRDQQGKVPGRRAFLPTWIVVVPALTVHRPLPGRFLQTNGRKKKIAFHT